MLVLNYGRKFGQAKKKKFGQAYFFFNFQTSKSFHREAVQGQDEDEEDEVDNKVMMRQFLQIAAQTITIEVNR